MVPSAWLWASMKPGTAVSPLASMIVSASPLAAPTAVILSSFMPMFPE